jgi:protein arginine phosphatase
MNVLFVCTGNTCRSSMAEGIAKEYLLSKGLSDIQLIFSAGISAFPGSPASNNAVEVMGEKKINISPHLATQLDKGTVEKADIILTMTMGHKAAIIRHFTDAEAKTFTLKEYVSNQQGDIPDPYGGDLNIYRTCAEELYKLVPLALDKLRKAIKEK